MGKTKIASIDDSKPSVKGKSKSAKGKTTTQNPNEDASLQDSKVIDAVEHSKEAEISQESGAKQIHSEASGEPSGTLEDSSEQPKKKKIKSSKASVKKGQVKYRSKKYKEASEKVEKSKRYPLNEAIDLAKQTSYSKFDGSLEIHLNTIAKNIRGLVSLPFASGKKLRILAFGPTSSKDFVGQEKALEESGAEIGDNAKLEEIIRGKTEFDVIVTTPDWMPRLARAAKILGPRGLMPSPKNGTITTDLKKAVTEIQSGKVEYKTEKNGQAIHLTLGKVSQNTDEVAQNTKILFNAIGKTRIKKAVISPTMGIGVKIDLASV